MEEINVQLLNMDTKIPEQLVRDADDSYTIFLNARLSQESLIKLYYHALQHIKNKDFEENDADSIVAKTHSIKFTAD